MRGRAMFRYIEGPLGSGKTDALLSDVDRLLSCEPASSILVLCSNNVRKARFTQHLLDTRTTPMGQMSVYTYAGFVRNILFNFWPLVEQKLSGAKPSDQISRDSTIQPELSSLEDSELILRWLLGELRQEWSSKGLEEPYANFPGSDRHILKQIIRRLRQRSENQLSRQDMKERSQELEEMCQLETAVLEQRFDRQSYRLRVLDTNKQLDVFHTLLREQNPLSDWLRDTVKHLIVDDVDETNAAQQQFIQWMAPHVETLILAADVEGGSRRGYLNAYPYDWEALKLLRPGETLTFSRTDVIHTAAQTLLNNWKRGEQEPFDPLPPAVNVIPGLMTRVDMLDRVVDDMVMLLERGAQPGDFCVILPKTDILGLHHVTQRLKRLGLPLQLLSGTKRPSDNPRCRAFLTLLHWANAQAWGIAPSSLDIKGVLIHVLHAHHWPDFSEEQLDTLVQRLHEQVTTACQLNVQKVEQTPTTAGETVVELSLLTDSQHEHSVISQSTETKPHVTPLALPTESLPWPLSDEAQIRYLDFVTWLGQAQSKPFDQQLFSAFNHLMTATATEKTSYADLNRIIQSYLRQKDIVQGLVSAQHATEGVASDIVGRFNRVWLTQVKTGSVADTPEVPEEVQDDAIIIATPQKAIDSEVYRNIQFWLDTSCREWARSDNAPLYNAWVHSAVWDGSNTAFSDEFNEAVIRARAGHITRTLMLLAKQQVRAYSSELDDYGQEQSSLLLPRLLPHPHSNGEQMLGFDSIERATLRADQAPILQYRQGTMSISAVPGAGKTFVSVELLLELIESGVEPDSILVLTYMDSAAKTLLSRLKKKLAGVTAKLPVVSTIHSLALRILMENDQCLLVNTTSDNMIILDDFGRNDILSKVANATMPESARNPMDWQRAIDRGVNHAKMSGLSPDDIARSSDKTFRLAEFLPAWQLYDEELLRTGSLDFTDLILKAVSILENYPDVRNKYQQRFRYIIEDEAQDSSKTLQAFIRLLGGDSPNLIRTGDTNQSITTTFSSADTSVFRTFVKEATHQVQMDRSGRCAPEVMELANHWMVAATKEPGLENAFEFVTMQVVEGQNPSLIEPLSAQSFESEVEEQAWLTRQIIALREKKPARENQKNSIAVLVRNNGQVNHITRMLQAADIPAVGLSDSLNTLPVFRRILATLRLIADPGNLALQSEWADLLAEAYLLPNEDGQQATRVEWLKSKPLLFTASSELMALNDEWLLQWHYDLMDFSRQASVGNLGTLIAQMTDRLCHATEDRSNGYLCALMADEILNETKTPPPLQNTQTNTQFSRSAPPEDYLPLSALDIVLRRFETFQRAWRGRKGFSDVLSRHGESVVQVMTLHKSKGQEFDAVFIPALQADAFPHAISAIRFDESDKLIKDIDKIASLQKRGVMPLPDDVYIEQKKREKIEEEARLVYVGITRAKKALYLSTHKQSARYGRLHPSEPALAFRLLSQYLDRQLSTRSDHPNKPSLTVVSGSSTHNGDVS